MKLLLWIGAGGFIGSISRYLLSRFFVSYAQISFPLGTFIVNILGCLLFGVFFGLGERMQWFSSEIRLFLMVGFCGSFTTFSTFAAESLQLIRDGLWLNFALYAAISLFAGIIFTWLGMQLVSIK